MGWSVDAAVGRARKRARAHYFEDGTVDFGAAVVCAALSALFAIEAAALPGSALDGWSAVALPFVVIGGVGAAKRLIGYLKERISYPRTGFVKAAEPSSRQRAVTSAVSAAAGFAIAAVIVRTDAVSLVPVLHGLVGGAFLAFLAVRPGVRRYAVLSACSVTIGAVAGLAAVGPEVAVAGFYGGMAACLIVSGSIALRTYLRAAPDPMHDGDVDAELRGGPEGGGPARVPGE